MVLPFAADNASPQTAAVADSLPDELIDSLSSIPSLRVISRSTSQLYKGQAVDIAALGQEIGVRYIVEGSVHAHNDVAQGDVALSDASNRVQLWTEHLERPLADLTSVRRDIIRAVRRQLQLSVILAEEAKQAPHPTADQPWTIFSRGAGRRSCAHRARG